MNKISVFFADSKPFSQLVGLALFLLLGFFAVVALQLVLPTPAPVTPEAVRVNLLWQGGSQLLLFLLPSLAFAWLFHGRAVDFLKMDLRGRKWLLALVALVVLLLLMPINDWLAYWNKMWQVGPLEPILRKQSEAAAELTEQLLSSDLVGDLLLQLLVVALLPAVCEEMFFRGCLQQTMCRWFGNGHVAVVVASLVFSLAHGDIYGLVPRFVLGVLLGYCFMLSGSLLVNVCVHFFNNAIVVAAYFLYHRRLILLDPSEPLFFSWPLTIVCGVAALLLFMVYFAQKRQKRR